MEIKAIITEYTSNKRIELTVKEAYKTESDILRFKAFIKDDILHRQSISNNIRKTDYYFVYKINRMWQMNDKTSISNTLYKRPSKETAYSNANDAKIDGSTIEVNGRLRSLKITAAVSRGWYKFIDTMPMTPSEVKIVKSILSMPSAVMSPKQYMLIQEIKAKVNKRRPVLS